MKLGIVSDLHLSFRKKDEILYIIDMIKDSDCDQMIYAGDIHELEQAREDFFNLCGKKFFSVLGNHDLYGKKIVDDYHVDGDISGGALWTNMGNNPILEMKAYKILNDFRHILNPSETAYVTPADMREIFDFQVARIFSRPTEVIVTHFAPCHLSIHKKYKDDWYNPYFVNDLFDNMNYMNITRLWVHGHVHNAFDYALPSGLRVVCNPLGYPKETYESVKDYSVKIVDTKENMMYCEVSSLTPELALDKVIKENQDKFAQAQVKPSLGGWFVGQVMKETGGKADPFRVQHLVDERLSS